MGSLFSMYFRLKQKNFRHFVWFIGIRVYLRHVFNQKLNNMSDLRIAVIEEVEYHFGSMLETPEEALAIADEILDLYEMLAIMEYLGPHTDAHYLNFAMQAYHHSVSSVRGEMFIDTVKRQFKGWKESRGYKAGV